MCNHFNSYPVFQYQILVKDALSKTAEWKVHLSSDDRDYIDRLFSQLFRSTVKRYKRVTKTLSKPSVRDQVNAYNQGRAAFKKELEDLQKKHQETGVPMSVLFLKECGDYLNSAGIESTHVPATLEKTSRSYFFWRFEDDSLLKIKRV